MKRTVNLEDFREAFKGDNHFSYEGLGVLFEYLDGEEDENMELCTISLCEYYEEYVSFEKFQGYYDGYESLDDVMNDTLVLMIDDASFIVMSNF